MNDIAMYYLVFALTTAFVGMLLIFRPMMLTLAEVRPHHNMIDYKVVAYLTFFTLMFIAAPLTFVATIRPDHGKRFSDSMLTAVLKEA